MIQVVILFIASIVFSTASCQAMLSDDITRPKTLEDPPCIEIPLVEVIENQEGQVTQRGLLGLVRDGGTQLKLFFSGSAQLKQVVFALFKLFLIGYVCTWGTIFMHEMGHALTAQAIFGQENSPINIHLAYSHSFNLTQTELNVLKQSQGITIHNALPFETVSYTIIPEQNLYVSLAGPLAGLAFNLSTQLWASYKENQKEEEPFKKNLINAIKKMYSLSGNDKTITTIGISVASLYGVYNSLLTNLFLPSTHNIDGVQMYKAFGMTNESLQSLYEVSPYVTASLIAFITGALVIKAMWNNGYIKELVSCIDNCLERYFPEEEF